mgnify:CR=1 FL=1
MEPIKITLEREQKLEAIYKEMANKELTLGCKIKVEYLTYYHWETGGEESYSKEDNLIIWVDWIASNGEVELDESDLSKAAPNWYIEELETYIKIIWHPIMIGAIFERYSSNKCFINSQFVMVLIDKRTSYDKPIEAQSDECIDYVYSLIPSISKK